MKRIHDKRKKRYKTIATYRIHTLMTIAEKSALQGHFNYANRYITLARKLAMRYLISIPSEYKQNICKNCYSYLLPGHNTRIRIHRGKLITKCHTCNYIQRRPLNNKKQ
jgi:ribonuclease P protein subunit RPR2